MSAAKEKIDNLLKWLVGHVNRYPGVNVTNFTTSWKDGKALYALMNSLLGDDVIPKSEMNEDKRHNFEKALNAAAKSGVPDLLEVDDLVEYPIDRLCMITYLHTVYKVLFLQKEARAKNKMAVKPIESENPFHKYHEEEN